ncbi:ATP-dependent DNA helicase [Mycena sanguinolenta]|uniref:ATP-dependent DNA helicase n=1 Tax=Mycena sanguinolenta TaxID=230812 RepID=A0A8H6XMC2_9AGAR|nr:ATP-dependent DNA helicase [Mycena sanguinolenta]
MSARSYSLFFRPNALRTQMSLGAPEPGPDVVHTDNETRERIIEIVNSTWDNGIGVGMRSLPSLIAPNSSVYRTDIRLETIRHAKSTPVLFVWMKAIDVISSHRPANAQYAVAFFIPSEEPFHVADLAYMLLRFQDFHIRDCDYQRFKLVSLSYQLAPNGTYGILLYDKDLRRAFRKALHGAREEPSKNKSAKFGHPISTWPPDLDSPAVRTPEIISALMSNIG